MAYQIRRQKEREHQFNQLEKNVIYVIFQYFSVHMIRYYITLLLSRILSPEQLSANSRQIQSIPHPQLFGFPDHRL